MPQFKKTQKPKPTLYLIIKHHIHLYLSQIQDRDAEEHKHC